MIEPTNWILDVKFTGKPAPGTWFCDPLSGETFVVPDGGGSPRKVLPKEPLLSKRRFFQIWSISVLVSLASAIGLVATGGGLWLLGFVPFLAVLPYGLHKGYLKLEPDEESV